MHMNSSIRLPVYLFVVFTTRYAWAMPVVKGPPVSSKEDTESLASHALGIFTNPDQRRRENSQANYARDFARSGADKGAIVGGTVAGGIIICFTIFFGVLIFKKYLASQEKGNRRIADGKPLRPRTETPGTTTSAHTSWRQTFNHRVSVPYADSVYSQRSLGNTSAATQISRASAQPILLPTVPSKAAQMLGVGNTQSTTPLAKTPLSSPRLPIIPLSENFMPETPILQYSSSQSSPKQSPLRRNPPLLPPPQNPPPQGPLPPVPTHETPAVMVSKSSRSPRDRTSSVCTMSSLGMELLRDVMQPPEKASFLRLPPPISKTNQPPPVAMRNSKGQNTVPDRRYFVPLFKNNGQLPSPTSPDEGVLSERGTRNRTENIINSKAETVLRDSSRAGLFSLGYNKI
ncbi:uncharacterized protein FPRO_09625 [Fusarium proliferatum ET1]|uniref:Uncharacterized protein n=2 Tax=Gibberella intermedia TaxID=948311 RepID=A0A1L7VPB8_FUSPR|nr:uncharacterized protein FPRO_09625 [Fusarium proliferatum ET1]RBA18564.1 hypothetical protein FPRO05_10212 [Fusarium proliferatum]CZR42323.1 uncharacterized protein FPRO_09625 [Fusarium proliferatum ET1]